MENKDVKVELTLLETTLIVSPNSLNFGEDGNTLTFTISCEGEDTLNWDLIEDADWIEADKYTGEASSSKETTVIITVDLSKHETGVHNSTVTVTSNGGNKTISVEMTVPGISKISVSPTVLVFGASSDEMNLYITNTGTTMLSWDINWNKSWITNIDPKSDFTSPGETTNPAITVTINRSDQDPGTYSDTLNIVSNGGTQNVDVKMTILPHDDEPPNIIFESGPDGKIDYDDVTFEWSGTDNKSSNLLYKYKLDGYEDWSSWASDTSKNYDNLLDDKYTFYVRAKDEAENESIAEQSFEIEILETVFLKFDFSENRDGVSNYYSNIDINFDDKSEIKDSCPDWASGYCECGLKISTRYFEDQNYFYPTSFADKGIKIDSSCTRVKVIIEGQLEVYKDRGGFYWETDLSNERTYFDFGSGCSIETKNIISDFIYDSPNYTKLFIGYDDTAPTAREYDGLIKSVEFIFENWEVTKAR